jgi:hypothetical protein
VSVSTVASRSPQHHEHAAPEPRAMRAPPAPHMVEGAGAGTLAFAGVSGLAFAGNLAVQRAYAAHGIHAKLAISQPGDADEREADSTADAMVSDGAVPAIHRKCAGCSGGASCGNCDEEAVERKASDAAPRHATRAAEHAVAAVRGGGQPLPQGVRRHFESRLGHDLGDVRFHTDAAASGAARAIRARAYTHGRDIAFAPGEYAPASREGRRLIAHELVHVVQHADAGPAVVSRNPDPNAPAANKDDAPPPLPTRPREGARQVWLKHFVVADDRDFMKGEMRRLIGSLGVAEADKAVAEMLVRTQPARIVPLPAHMAATGGFRPQTQYDAAQQTAEEGFLIAMAPLVKEIYLGERTDAVKFLTTFTDQVRANAYDTLAASKNRANAEKLRYGLSDEVIKTREARRHKEADGGWVEDPAEYKTVYHIADADSPAVKNMQTAANVLLVRRQEIDKAQSDLGTRRASSCNQGYCPSKEYFAADEAKIDKLRSDYNKLREQLTFQYPIIDRAADLDSGSAGQLADIANAKSPQDLATNLGERIADNLSDIARADEGIRNGHVNIWRLKALVDLAKAQLEVEGNPARKRVVEDKFQEEQPNVIDAVLEGIALLLLNIGAILLAPATGGISLGVAAAVNVGLAAKHTVDYIYDKAAAGSDLRRAQALSASDPSLFWLAVEIVGAFVDAGSAIAAMKTLGPLAKAAQAAKEGKAAAETVEAIEIAARNLGKPELAQKIISKAGAAEKAALEAAGATEKEIAALTKVSSAVEKEAGETIGASVRTAAQTEVKCSKAGHLFSCSSPCVVLREKYANILAKDNEFYDKLVRLEQDASKAAKAREAATAAKDSKAVAEADKEINRVKQAAKDLEEGISAKYVKPTAGEAEVEAAEALKQAQAEEAFAKGKSGSRVDLTEMRTKPTPERPPGVAADDPLWKDYEKYYAQRRASIVDNATGVSRPLKWEEYSEFLGKFRRGTAYQKTVLEGVEADAALIRKGQAAPAGAPMQGMKDPEVLSNVGVAGKTEGETTKFVDQLIVDRSTLGGTAKPSIEALSNKSRNFGEIIKAEGNGGLAKQVAADAQEALSKYGGEVTIRRQAVTRINAAGKPETVPFELFNDTVKVDKVYLVYDKSFLGDPAKATDLIRAIERAADSVSVKGQKVIVLFK